MLDPDVEAEAVPKVEARSGIWAAVAAALGALSASRPLRLRPLPLPREVAELCEFIVQERAGRGWGDVLLSFAPPPILPWSLRPRLWPLDPVVPDSHSPRPTSGPPPTPGLEEEALFWPGSAFPHCGW